MTALRVSLLVLCLTAPAAGQVNATCPVDQTPLRLTSAPSNLGGGVDSDGCAYAVDAQGARRVVGLDQVVSCPTCHVALRRDHLLGKRPDAETVATIKATVAKTRKGWPAEKELSPVRRHELAAAIYGAVGTAPFGKPANRAQVVATLLLRAAWAARARAVLGGPDGGYRPRTIAEARAQLETLEQRARHDPSRDPAVRTLDQQLEALDDARAGMAKLGPGLDAPGRLGALRSLDRLRLVEQRLLLRKHELLEKRETGEGRLSDRELKLAVVRAWIRAGDPARWRPALAALEKRRATWATARLIREACADEARLLELAEAQLLRARDAAKTPTARAQYLFLAGDAARRRGQTKTAHQRLREAIRLAPKSPAGLRSAAVLER